MPVNVQSINLFPNGLTANVVNVSSPVNNRTMPVDILVSLAEGSTATVTLQVSSPTVQLSDGSFITSPFVDVLDPITGSPFSISESGLRYGIKIPASCNLQVTVQGVTDVDTDNATLVLLCP